MPPWGGSTKSGVPFAISVIVERYKGQSEDLDALLERADEVCREAERTDVYAREGMSRRPFYPDRRRMPRFPEPQGSDGDNNAGA
jgi:hypothetical protein